jgi:two-component system sensor histidine kinase HydH
MGRTRRRIAGWWWLSVALLLPVALVVSSLVTFRELQRMQGIYLRDRAATLASRLETLAPQSFAESLALLAAEEPGLVDIRVFRAEEQTPERPAMEPIWRGQQLFKTQEVTLEGVKIFRAYIPLHVNGELLVARIDLAAAAADFLVAVARQNVLVAMATGVVLLGLWAYAVWAARRTARLEQRQLALEHLARLGQLSAVLAHEIRTPLGTIKGFAQLAAEKADPGSLPLLEPILGEVRRLERLVTDLLLYGRPPEPVLSQADWASLCGELEARARQAIGDQPIRFSCQTQPWRLRTDPHLLSQVLYNLIRNSIEALEGRQNGEVRLQAVRPPAGGLVISVEDDGPGLAPEVRARLVEPFATTKSSGTGLGLSIARNLTVALGGQLTLEPIDPQGTRAELDFPGMPVEEAATGGGTAWQPS